MAVCDLDIYYNSLAGSDHINCWCTRWSVSNYSITIETILNKTDLGTLQSNTVPGAVGELYKVLGKPRFYDKTWTGSNTLMLSPSSNVQSNLKNMRDDKLIFVKNMTSSPFEGDQGYLQVKIEGYISGSLD